MPLGAFEQHRRIANSIQAASDLYLERGIESVKMTDIAERCGIGVASLYRYFQTKQLFTVKAACFIWSERLEDFGERFSNIDFGGICGLEQLRAILVQFFSLDGLQRDFFRFIAEFDAFVLSEGITPQQLEEYEAGVLRARELVLRPLELGLSDGSVRTDIDWERYYFTVSHSLMGLCRKFAAGAILSSDSTQAAREEIELAIEMFISYIKK